MEKVSACPSCGSPIYQQEASPNSPVHHTCSCVKHDTPSHERGPQGEEPVEGRRGEFHINE